MKVLTNPEQFAANNRAHIESLLTLTDGLISMFDRLLTLNLSFASDLIEEALAKTSTLARMDGPQELLSLPAALVQPLIEKSAAYARDVSEILTDGQHGVGALIDARVGALNKTLALELAHAAKSAPGGSEALLEGMKSALAVGNVAYDGASRAARQLVGLTETNLVRSTEVTVQALIAEKAD